MPAKKREAVSKVKTERIGPKRELLVKLFLSAKEAAEAARKAEKAANRAIEAAIGLVLADKPKGRKGFSP